MRTDEIASLEIYLDNRPESVLYPKLAQLYLEAGDINNAIEYCKKELTIRPYSPYGFYLWALTAQIAGDLPLAIQKLQDTVQVDPYFMAAYYRLVELGRSYLDSGAYKKYLMRLIELNPIDATLAKKLESFSSDASRPTPKAKPTPTPPPIEPMVNAAVPPEPALVEPDLDTILQATAPAPAVEPLVEKEITQFFIPEEEAHLGPVEVELEESPEPVEFELPPREEEAPPTTAPSPISELFNKLKTKPLEELQKEEWNFPRPTEPPMEPQIAAPESARSIAPSNENLGDEAAPPPSTSTPPEATTTPKPPTVKKTTARKKSTKSANNDSEGEVSIKFPIPTWTLVEILKKQQLYQQALEVIDIIEKKSQKHETLEKARQMRAEIEQLMAEE